MNRVCVDTSAHGHFQRGDHGVVELLSEAEWVGLPVIALGELLVGFQLRSRQERNQSQLRAFRSNPVVEVVDVDDAAALHFADIVLDLRRSGTPIPTNDIWIAATAASRGAIVVTYDDHFDAIAQGWLGRARHHMSIHLLN